MNKRDYQFRNLLFATIMLLIIALPVSANAATSKAYTISSSDTRVYSNPALTKGYGWIYGSDEVTIKEIKASYCKVTYPIAKGTKTGYIKTSALFTKTSGKVYSAKAAATTYRRPGGTKYGSIYKGDSVLVLGTNGSYTQVRYPVSGGYKYAFITTSDCNTKIIGTNSVPNTQGALSQAEITNAAKKYGIKTSSNAYQALCSINSKYSNVLKTNAKGTSVFLFEGVGNKTSANTRMNAMCVVVRKGKII